MASRDSAYTKITRAETHLEALDQEINRFRPLNFDRVLRDNDPETGDIIWRFRGSPVPPPVSISPILGDALYNLRSALDHLAWSVVEACGGAPDNRTAFPLYIDGGLFKSEGMRKLRGMSDEAIALVKENQPYRPWNNNHFRQLWWLEDLSNIDKHRYFNLVVCATAGGLLSHAIPVTDKMFIHQGGVEDGTILARISGHNEDVEFYPIFDVSVSQTNGPLVSLSFDLKMIAIRVKDIVGQFGKFF